MVEDPAHWEVRVLDEYMDVSAMDCGPEPWATDLTDFLKEDALEQQIHGLNKTICFLHDGEWVGFASLLSSSIRVEDVPELTDRAGLDVGLKEFPCVLVGRFGVHKDVQGRGYGAFMLGWIIAETLETNLGVRFLSLHVDGDNTRARTFWERHGFFLVTELSDSHLRFMLYDLYQS